MLSVHTTVAPYLHDRRISTSPRVAVDLRSHERTPTVRCQYTKTAAFLPLVNGLVLVRGQLLTQWPWRGKRFVSYDLQHELLSKDAHPLTFTIDGCAGSR